MSAACGSNSDRNEQNACLIYEAVFFFRSSDSFVSPWSVWLSSCDVKCLPVRRQSCALSLVVFILFRVVLRVSCMELSALWPGQLHKCQLSMSSYLHRGALSSGLLLSSGKSWALTLSSRHLLQPFWYLIIDSICDRAQNALIYVNNLLIINLTYSLSLKVCIRYCKWPLITNP